jgi:hypothetical protein
MRRITLMLLCGVSLWGCGAAGRYLGPTVHGDAAGAGARRERTARGGRPRAPVLT